MIVEALDARSLPAYLVGRGLVADLATVTVRPLTGGVSNTVFLVETDTARWVVKQSLPRLAVADEWLAKQERLLTEGAALEVAGKLLPGIGPEVVDMDHDRFVLVMTAAPAEWVTWKEHLLSGRVDGGVARFLGAALGACHARTTGDADVAARFNDMEAFEQLRVDPYYRTVARRRPELAPAIDALIERMLATHTCLVHGDYSPKNILVGARAGGDTGAGTGSPEGAGPWVLDWEVAHVGDPAFDLGFMTSHLVLKAVHQPALGMELRGCVDALWAAYFEANAGSSRPDADHVLAHLGALLVSRVHGKSPVEYLGDEGWVRAAGLGTDLLCGRLSSLEDVWSSVGSAGAR
ncbi:MAG: hypothetical protein QOK43_257 [Acidimicrobiaceae bacterium]|nr:hypothetical protein [Acidimicrobiaceae bacterium]